MNDIVPWLDQGSPFGNSVTRQRRRDLDQVAFDHFIRTAREQAIAAETAMAINNTVWLARMTRDSLKDIPEAAPLVMPLLEGYAQGARLRTQFRL